MTQPTKQRKVWDKFIDDRDIDKWEHAREWTIIAIDSKWRYICEYEWLDWQVFAEDSLEFAKEEKGTDWIDSAFNEWIMNIKKDCLRWFNKASFREAIEKHILHKQELIPIDVDIIAHKIDKAVNTYKEISKLWEWYYRTMGTWIEYIKQILSKYGTTPQKKRSYLEYIDLYRKYASNDSERDMLYKFLKDNWLLEE